MTLPAEITEHLGKVRAAYLAHFKQQVDDAVARKADQVIVEAAIAPEGEQAQHRIDLVTRTGDSFERHFIIAPSSTPWQHSEHAVGDAQLLVDETVWWAFTVIAAPVPADRAFVQAWFRKYFDHGAPADAQVEPPFAGHVHFLDVEVFDDGYRIDLDLGSAPVSAVEELVDACIAHGATRVWLMSGADALAARIDVDADAGDDDDDDDADSGMLELPDELLEHLAAVRASYLDALVARLRKTTGKVAIEPGAGKTQGELAIRVDFVELGDSGEMQPHDVTDVKAIPWDEGHYDLAELRLYVMKLVWPSVVVLGWPAPADTSWLDAWYRRWLEQGFAVEEPFGGYVHSMSEVHRKDDRMPIDSASSPDTLRGPGQPSLAVLIDFGTAPVEALRQLVELFVRHGVTTVSIGSGSGTE